MPNSNDPGQEEGPPDFTNGALSILTDDQISIDPNQHFSNLVMLHAFGSCLVNQRCLCLVGYSK